MSGLAIGFCLQNPSIPLDESDAAWLQVKQVVEGLRAAGHEVEFLLSRAPAQVVRLTGGQGQAACRLGVLEARLVQHLERAVRRGQRGLGLPYLALFEGLRMASACAHELRSADLVHERNTLFGFGAALSALRLRKPYVLSVDADVLQELDYLGIRMGTAQRAFQSWCARFSYARADAITCVSAMAKDNLVRKWGVPEARVWVIPNGVDASRFSTLLGEPSSLRDEIGIGEAPVVMCVSGFWRWHALDELVDSFALVLSDVPQAKLVLVGDGMERPAVARQVADRGLGASVILPGRVAHAEVPRWLAMADVAVSVYPRELATDFWGSPMKLREYMAAGKAIVASDAGEVRSVIEDGVTGILVEPGDRTAFARAVTDLLQHPDKRGMLGARARREALERHSWHGYIGRLEEVYRSALSCWGRRAGDNG